MVIALVVLTMVTRSWNWLLFAGLIAALGMRDHPPTIDPSPLDGRRRALAVLMLVILVISFTPVPITLPGS